MRCIGNTVDTHQCPGSVYLTCDLRHIVDTAGNVGEMAETNEPRPRIEQLLQFRYDELGRLRAKTLFADCKAELLKPPPSAAIGLMVQIGDDDFIAWLEPTADSMR